jgi:hypothetical protein
LAPHDDRRRGFVQEKREGERRGMQRLMEILKGSKLSTGHGEEKLM